MSLALTITGLSIFVDGAELYLSTCVLAMLIVPIKIKVDQVVYWAFPSKKVVAIGEERYICNRRISATNILAERCFVFVLGVDFSISQLDYYFPIHDDGVSVSDDFIGISKQVNACLLLRFAVRG